MLIVTTAIVLMAIILAYIIRNLNEALNPGNTVMNQASAMANASDNASEAAADSIHLFGADADEMQRYLDRLNEYGGMKEKYNFWSDF